MVGRKALVVDDDDDIRALVTELLRHSGFEVDEAADGSTALAAVRRDEPDLVVDAILAAQRAAQT